MDDGLKQRLIGAFVLLALAVIFLPAIFDRERIQPVDTATQIPLAPIIEPVVIEKPEPPVVEHKAKPADEMYVPDDRVVENDGLEVAKFDADGVPNNWVLQVASFATAKRAMELRDKLVGDGYTSYTRSVETKDGVMIRVYVGPKLEKGILLKDKINIEKKYKISTMILKFKP